MSETNTREELLNFIFEHSFLRGKFILASGKESDFYLDAKQTTLDAQGSLLVAEALLDVIRKSGVHSIGGLEIGAVPIVSSVVALSALRGYPVTGFIVRKQAKKHGTHKLIEGKIKKNDRVIVIDDVVTTGTSAMDAVQAVRGQGCQVVKVVSLIDRNEGGVQLFRKMGLEYEPIITIKEIFALEADQRRDSRVSSGSSREKEPVLVAL